TALQAALGRHAHVGRVLLRPAEPWVRKPGEALGTFPLTPVEIVSDGADEGETRAGETGDGTTEQLVGRAGAVGVRCEHRRDSLVRAQQGREAVLIDRLTEVHEATAAPCPDRGSCQFRRTLHPYVFTRGPHGMADDTRVTHTRVGLACAVALI